MFTNIQYSTNIVCPQILYVPLTCVKSLIYLASKGFLTNTIFPWERFQDPLTVVLSFFQLSTFDFVTLLINVANFLHTLKIFTLGQDKLMREGRRTDEEKFNLKVWHYRHSMFTCFQLKFFVFSLKPYPLHTLTAGQGIDPTHHFTLVSHAVRITFCDSNQDGTKI